MFPCSKSKAKVRIRGENAEIESREREKASESLKNRPDQKRCWSIPSQDAFESLSSPQFVFFPRFHHLQFPESAPLFKVSPTEIWIEIDKMYKMYLENEALHYNFLY